MPEFGAKHEESAEQRCRSGTSMRDVANAAGVSVATVSNVINHPHLVAAATREKVGDIVEALGFSPNPHARALRASGPPSSTAREDIVDGVKPLTSDDTEPLAGSVVQGQDESPSLSHLNMSMYVPGARRELQVGSEILSGVVDSVMPDGSYFWIWTDNGMGRRLIDASEAVPMAKQEGL